MNQCEYIFIEVDWYQSDDIISWYWTITDSSISVYVLCGSSRYETFSVEKVAWGDDYDS